MLSIIKSMSINGLEGYLTEVQVDVSNGIPHWEIVGLADTSIKESRERVNIAIKNSGYEINNKKVVINLAPANLRKEGSSFDLAIAIGILKSSNKLVNRDIENMIFLGELSLDGTINKINGILPICIEAKNIGIKKAIIPIQNYKEASLVNDIEIIGVSSLKETVEYINYNNYKKTNINLNFTIKEDLDNLDFSDVKGQENAKRALEIVASGRT